MDTYLTIFLFILILKAISYLLQYNKPIVTESMKNVLNYGETGSTENVQAEMMKTYKVEYAKRPSLTGIYTETGPLGANIGCYDSQTQACNCISNPTK